MLLGPSLIQTQPVSQQPTLQSPVQSPTLPAHTPPQIQQHLPAIPVAQVTLTPREMAKIGANGTTVLTVFFLIVLIRYNYSRLAILCARNAQCSIKPDAAVDNSSYNCCR